MNEKKSYLIFVAKIISGYIAFIFILYSVADSYRHSNNRSIFVIMSILSIAFIILVAKDMSLKIKKANEYEKLTEDYYIVRLPYREKSIYLFDSFDDRSIFLTSLMDFCTTREQLEEESIEAIKEMINSKYDEYRSSRSWIICSSPHSNSL